MMDNTPLRRILDAPKNRTERWDFHSIRSGEEVLAPITGGGKVPAVYAALQRHQKQFGKKFATKREGEFLSIWRNY